jgi:hypothetical protein
VRAVRRWFIQKHDRLGRVHKLWIWHVLANRSRHVCRGVPRVPGQLRCVVQWLQRIQHVHLQLRLYQQRKFHRSVLEHGMCEIRRSYSIDT